MIQCRTECCLMMGGDICVADEEVAGEEDDNASPDLLGCIYDSMMDGQSDSLWQSGCEMTS